ncbi:MAG: FAD:protein FMN transferase, partial [Deltaproteobacteria bacterium]
WVAVVDEGHELGTSWAVEVLVRPGEAERARADLAAAHAQCRRLEAVFSEWRADSELSRVNAQAGDGPVAVSEDLRRLLRGALEIARATDGAFDPTWLPLDAVWKQAAERDRPPSAEALAAARAQVGWRHVVLDDAGVRFDRAGVRLGLGGVAKGWIIDAVFLELRRRGYTSVVVNLGGDLRATGAAADGSPRVVRIADPWLQRRTAATFEVRDGAVATSGNYLRRRVVGDRSVGHILDPRTGEPPSFDGSVTVLTRDAAMADALATALFVMGPERGLELARSTPGVDAVYVTRDGVRSTLARVDEVPGEPPGDPTP